MIRAARLLAVVERLRGQRQPVAGATLAAELGISLRTLYRDIATLQQQGAAIEGSPGLGYVLRPGHALATLTFRPDEIEALMLGLRWVEQRSGDVALAQAARSAQTRLQEVVPPAARAVMSAPSFIAR